MWNKETMYLRITTFDKRDILKQVSPRTTAANVLEELSYPSSVYSLFSTTGFELPSDFDLTCICSDHEHLLVKVPTRNFDLYWDSLPCDRRVRCELACCYRLMDEWNWTDTIYGHLTARTTAPDGSNAFLINPFGLLYREITASSLVTVDLDGNIVDPGSVGATFGINRAGYVIHAAVHAARPEIHCVMHTHTIDGVAVSSTEEGILPLTQTSQILGPVTYHEYEGIAVNMEEQQRLKQDLGTISRVLVLRNHGLVTMGSCVGEALLKMHYANAACAFQVRAHTQKVRLPPPETAERTYAIAAGFIKDGVGQREMRAFARDMFSKDHSFVL